MIRGMIAGEIIGSPYRKDNLPGINDIFFPLFGENRVMDPKTYRETVHRPAAGRLTASLLALHTRGGNPAEGSSGNPGEALCGAVHVGATNAAMPDTDMERHRDITARYAAFWPEEMKESIVAAADAAYRLSRRLGDTLSRQLGFGITDPPTPEVVSAQLRGQIVPQSDGTYKRGDGTPSDAAVLEGAFCALLQSRSWEETVRRAVALGGDSALVGALAGGLAEIAFGLPETISYRIGDYLDPGELRLLETAERDIRSLSEPERAREWQQEQQTPVHLRALSLPGRATVYAVPEGRPDIEKAIRRVNPDCVFVREEGLRRMMERLETRRDEAGEPLSGTFIDSPRPEVRHLYFNTADGKLYSPSTLPQARGFTPPDVRMKARSEFARFVTLASQVRDEQERRAGHDPARGHLRFASAWYLDIERDRVRLLKGDTVYGEFGLDEKGRMRVNTNVVGGSFGGEYLQASLDNRRVFHRSDGPAEVLSRIREKCLDDGFIPDGEGTLLSNAELMERDLRQCPGEIPSAAPVEDGEMSCRTRSTRTRSDWGTSGEAQTFNEALYSRMHPGAVFTVGHSNLSLEAFIANLRRNGITTVRDVRSWPQSRNYPHFGREALQKALQEAGIRYVFNGDTMGGHIRRTSFPSEAGGVRFTLSEGGYARRTRENARETDLTIAFAADFTTAGERLTCEAAAGKIIQIPLEKGQTDAAQIASDILSCMTEKEKTGSLTVNIAGNGMQTLAARGFTQQEVDGIVTGVLRELTEKHGVRIGGIRSGGQTGADQAGITAAKELGIPAHVHAPKGWMMRGEDGKDIFSEHAFKSRFIALPEKELTYGETTATEGFRRTYDEIVADARKGERQALMCAETSPTDCHRWACLGYALSHPALVGRRYNPIEVQHIRRDGSTVSQEVLERKACRDAGVRYTEAELAGVMRKAGEKIRNPRPGEQPISLRRNYNNRNTNSTRR